MQFTYEYCHHLTCGVGGVEFYGSTYHSSLPQALPLLKFKTQ
jgi:hypothetical protein